MPTVIWKEGGVEARGNRSQSLAKEYVKWSCDPHDPGIPGWWKGQGETDWPKEGQVWKLLRANRRPCSQGAC